MRLAVLAERIATASNGELAEALAEYDRTLIEFSGGGSRRQADAAAVLAGLGLAEVQPTRPCRFSAVGKRRGWGWRGSCCNPSLLLDEPTNHLDMTALEWLEGYLHQYSGAMLIVSHDRMFLDRIVNWILEIDPQSRQARMYPGSYSDYVAAKERERHKHWQAYKEQEERIAQLESAVQQLKGQAREHRKGNDQLSLSQKGQEGGAPGRGAAEAHRAHDRVGEPRGETQLSWDMNLEFANTPPSGQDVLVLEDVGKRYGDHVLFEGVNLILQRGERVTLVGPNGSGKTTLLRMITGREVPSAGVLQRGANVHVGYFSQEQESLDWGVTPLETVQRVSGMGETEARTFLHLMLFAGDDVFVPVSDLSYGQRARLALGVLVLQGCNLLLLDEPINHLDIPSRENFERALSAYRGTILAVVHDRYFIQHFATALWSVEEREVHV